MNYKHQKKSESN